MSAPSLLERGRRGEPLTDEDIVDLHGHLGPYSFAIPDATPAALVSVMDRTGVRAIVCSHIHCITGHVESGNATVLDAMRAFPGRILGYVALWPSSAAEVAEQARRYLDAGFTGLKIHNANGFAYTDPAYAPALALANERHMPVLLHTWAQAAEFAEVRELAPRYPECSFLLAHTANGMGTADYTRIARELPNVYLDLCASRTPLGLVDRLVQEAGADKVVWTSDALFINLAHQLGKVLGARLGDADKRTILSTNARRILGRVIR
jgi:predicted TIM-barrel fold metal-dependent hydrolase